MGPMWFRPRGWMRDWLPILLLACWGHPGGAATLEVPSAHSTITSGIEAALDGDTVLVAPGIYQESPVLANKTITLASHYHTTGNRDLISRTIIDGADSAWVINVHSSAGPATTIVGFTLRNADDGVTATGRFAFLDNHVTGCSDGIDYEDGSGGLVRSCLFEGNSDDGIDLDDDVAVVIENNTIRNNGDDGIEVRLQSYVGPPLEIVIRDNEISGNEEDGIQLIGYDTLTARVFRIERNQIVGNAMAGIGMMCCANTIEDFQGASLRERVFLYHNTFVGNDHGVTGGDSLIALNNLFTGTTRIALKWVDGGSIAAHNLFFANGTNHSQSNVDAATTLLTDPLLRSDYRLSAESPAIDAGAAFFRWHGEVVLDRSPTSYSGAAPDLGAQEHWAGPPGVPGVSKSGIAALLSLLFGIAAGTLGTQVLRRRPTIALPSAPHAGR